MTFSRVTYIKATVRKMPFGRMTLKSMAVCSFYKISDFRKHFVLQIVILINVNAPFQHISAKAKCSS